MQINETRGLLITYILTFATKYQQFAHSQNLSV